MTDLAAFLAALAIALVATPLAAAVARRYGIVDRPGPLKIHDKPVPYLGGVAVFVAVAGPVAVAHVALLVPLALLVGLGLVDDLAGLPPVLRLVAEIAVGLVAGMVVAMPGRFGVVATAAAVVVMVNAVNLLDGLDGLAAGVSLASALGFAVLGGPARIPGLALAGALAGFLWFNRPPARIYLGDSGAYLCGGALAMLAALVLGDRDSSSAWVAIPLLVAVPVFDTLAAVLRRWRSRRPLFMGDRSHIYDQLVDRGQSRSVVVMECVAAQAALCAVGVAATSWSVAAAAFATTACTTLLVIVATWGGFLSKLEPST
jgi:UDP-GlcNAc:undecaprenyl-phosphate GlcNAc-1-phosphate transferase